MDKTAIILVILWFAVFTFLITGICFAISYTAEHYTVCWSCREQVDKQSVYCTHCGADMTPMCVDCGAECYSAFCGQCGSPMNQEG